MLGRVGGGGGGGREEERGMGNVWVCFERGVQARCEI